MASSSDTNDLDLLRAAVLNYLAVCKISKKHAKLAAQRNDDAMQIGASDLPAAIERELKASSFCVALRDRRSALERKAASKAASTASGFVISPEV